eukprot:jgi/Botrbrau1/6638/Bobra.104_2s0025.1
MELRRMFAWILLGYAIVGASAQSSGNGNATNSASLAGAVNALAALFGGGGSTASSISATGNSTFPLIPASGSPAPSPGAINTRIAGQRTSRTSTAYQSNTQECVRQAFNLQTGACAYVSNQVSQGNQEAPGIMSATCDDLVRVWTAEENLPTHSCCEDLVRFIEDGCTCNQQVLSLAQNLGGVNPTTIAATARKAQVSCGRGQIYDPCTAGYGC